MLWGTWERLHCEEKLRSYLFIMPTIVREPANLVLVHKIGAMLLP